MVNAADGDDKDESPHGGSAAWPPQHPGQELRDIILPALGVSAVRAAAMMRVPEQTLHELLDEKQPITPEMALRIGKLCGNGPGVWLRMQQEHDLWRVERDITAELELIPTMQLRRRPAGGD